ncbi:MAG: isoprenyl transferase [Deltaproteobacteria bacterium]|nr:isoprenyl transferase [Deltaproteobacteria bacterium]NIS78596.1 isoprenyl transferase [Deltaproteobacteria bacterium]
MTLLQVPRHVAVIMDGNGRWAEMKKMPRVFGHRAGMKSVRRAVEYAHQNKIQYLTLFAFSMENWGRPRDEVDALMNLLKEYIDRELSEMVSKGIRLNVIGNRDMIPGHVQERIDYALAETGENDGLVLTLALSYSGRDEIVRAVQKILDEGRHEKGAELLDENEFGRFLDTSGIPDPDLLIRTSGEIRISNFMLWQLAYTEIYITDKLWPQFTKKDFDRAIREFSRRKRRFGLTREQVDASP